MTVNSVKFTEQITLTDGVSVDEISEELAGVREIDFDHSDNSVTVHFDSGLSVNVYPRFIQLLRWRIDKNHAGA